MKFDSHGLIVMEHVDFPGSVGDSCAETFRYFLLRRFLRIGNDEEKVEAALTATKTGAGLLRHPNAPWREDDFSCDQWLPRFLTLAVLRPQVLTEAIRIRAQRFRTGNGDLVSPVAFAAIIRFLRDKATWLDLTLWLQTFLFQFPIRWNDERRWFEKSSESSSDYLNWFMYLIYTEIHGPSFWSVRAKKRVDPKILSQKVEHYYRGEPHAFVLPLYEEAIRKIWPSCGF
jgi:hypothetical protein